MLETIEQYVGQTINDFRFRLNNYKDNNRKCHRSDMCMQEHLFKHFLSPGHNGFLNNVSITFINKTDLSDPLKRENYWIYLAFRLRCCFGPF